LNKKNNIDNIVNLKFKWDENTFLKGAKIAYDLQMKHSGRKYVGWFFIALLQFGVVGALKVHSYGLLYLSTFLLLYWYGFRWPIRKAALKRFFKKLPFSDEMLNIEADDGGICLNDRCIPWNEFKRILVTREGYLMDMEDAFIYIPKGHFANDKDREKFYDLVRNSAEHFIQMDTK